MFFILSCVEVPRQETKQEFKEKKKESTMLPTRTRPFGEPEISAREILMYVVILLVAGVLLTYCPLDDPSSIMRQSAAATGERPLPVEL